MRFMPSVRDALPAGDIRDWRRSRHGRNGSRRELSAPRVAATAVGWSREERAVRHKRSSTGSDTMGALHRPQETLTDAPRRDFPLRPSRGPHGGRPPRRRPPGHRRRGWLPQPPPSATSPGPRPSRTDEATTAAAQWLVWEASQALGAHSASIQEPVRGPRPRRGAAASPCPAINIRAQTFDMARTMFEAAAAARRRHGHLRARHAASRPTRTSARSTTRPRSSPGRSPRTGTAPVFIQGDHYQFNAKKYAADPEAMTEEIRRACRLAIDAGYRNIDIDSSTLVDLSKPTLDEQQRENYVRGGRADGADPHARDATASRSASAARSARSATRTRRSRSSRPTSTATGASCDARQPGAAGISKVSVQTGTSHGGVPLARRRRRRGQARLRGPRASSARSRARSTAWRAPCSTARRRCPTSCSTASRRSRRAEIHLATGFQNALYEHPAFPDELHKARSRRGARRERADERKEGQTDEQFVLHDPQEGDRAVQARAVGLATKDEILAAAHRKVSFLFQELRVAGTREMVDRYIQPVELHRPLPEGLRAVAPVR